MQDRQINAAPNFREFSAPPGGPGSRGTDPVRNGTQANSKLIPEANYKVRSGALCVLAGRPGRHIKDRT